MIMRQVRLNTNREHEARHLLDWTRYATIEELRRYGRRSSVARGMYEQELMLGLLNVRLDKLY